MDKEGAKHNFKYIIVTSAIILASEIWFLQTFKSNMVSIFTNSVEITQIAIDAVFVTISVINLDFI